LYAVQTEDADCAQVMKRGSVVSKVGRKIVNRERIALWYCLREN
jgi:hypothetical protein